MLKSAVELAAATRVRLEPGWRLGRQVHPTQWQLLVILRGRLWAQVGELQVEAGSGQTLLYAAGQPHIERNLGPDWIEAIYLGFEGPPPAEPPAPLGVDEGGRVAWLAEWLVDLSAQPGGPVWSRLGEALLAAVLHPPAAPLGLVQRAQAAMRARMGEPLRLAALADEAGLSRAHFLRAYAALAGETPMRSLRRIRLEEASRLLRATGLPLRAIAARTGFADEFHFSKAFRQRYGAPPSAMRGASQR